MDLNEFRRMRESPTGSSKFYEHMYLTLFAGKNCEMKSTELYFVKKHTLMY